MITLKNALLIVTAAILVASAMHTTRAEPPKAPEKDARILPVVVVKAGDTQELVMTASCHLGPTRGGGLSVKLMGDKEKITKTWTRDGVTVTVPDFEAASKGADDPLFAPLKEKGLNAFTVKVVTTAEAKPGLLDFHLADNTCSGDCSSDFRVLVVAKK